MDSADTRQINFTNSTTDLSGNYVITFINSEGYVNHQIFDLTVSPITSVVDQISTQSLEMPTLINQGSAFTPLKHTENMYLYTITVSDINGHVIFSSESLENPWVPSSNQDQLFVYTIQHTTTGELIKGKVFVH